MMHPAVVVAATAVDAYHSLFLLIFTSTPPALHSMHNELIPIAPPLNLHDHARASHQPITLSAPPNHPYQQPLLGFNNSLALNPFNFGISLNLHLGNAMSPPPNQVGT